MTEDFVSFEIAKRLKKKGFDWRVNYAYDNNGECKYIITEYDVDYIPAPTISQVLKWLRDKGWHLYTYPIGFGMWKFSVVDIVTLEERSLCCKFNSNENACIMGIEYYLDNLI